MSAQQDVVLIDAGGSNIESVQAAFERLDVRADMTADHDRIRAASHVILPGVGAARPGMQRLIDDGLDHLIRDLRQPVLGICLGMQLLFDASDESDTRCLGILSGRVTRFSELESGRVPHMGWNRLRNVRQSALMDQIDDDGHAYFVHSYAAPVTADTVVAGTYGRSFSAVVSRGNFHGAQFHPERSSVLGSRFLQNFLRLS